MAEPTTSGGGSTRPAREVEHREAHPEIGGERGESTLAATNGTFAPPRQTVAYVRWKLEQLSGDSFRGQLVELLGKADGWNLERVRLGFPLEVAAWEAWYHSPTGEFDVPEIPSPSDDRLYLHSRCHAYARAVAWVDANGLTVACGECEKPIVMWPKSPVTEAIRHLGCQAGGHCTHG